MELIFLGTGGAIPTKDRGLPSVILCRGPELFMFDCGESSQRQMTIAKIGFNKQMRIFISHMHGDHVLGLPGLFQSMSFLGRERKLEVYGPKGILEFIECISNTVPFNKRFPIEIRQIESGSILEEREYHVKATNLDHSTPCLGFSLIEKDKPGKFDPAKAKALMIPEGPLWKRLQHGEKFLLGKITVMPDQILGPPRRGLKITYITDTKPCKEAIDLAKNSDLLMYDCTFDSSKAEKANQYGHSTAEDAAFLAKKADVKKLVLLHISAIYKDATLLLEEAKQIFPNVLLASDLMRLSIDA